MREYNETHCWQYDIRLSNRTEDLLKVGLSEEDIAARIRRLSKEYMLSCECREIGKKHKYVYVLGENKSETKLLRREFLERNKLYSYPKERGK